MKILPATAALAALTLLGACDTGPPPVDSVGDAERGRMLLWQFGCGSCHEIDGVVGAVGRVGPPLDRFARRVYIAGVLANTPENLQRWIRAPQEIDPQSAMPDLGVSAEQARDMTAYLYGTK
jgi:cytochrome c2